jgi:D-sedoheptulose 7-phosphate isomerase
VSIESLYPFLYEDKTDLAAVLEQVRASTVAKAGEIIELRAAIAKQDGARLEECARETARRFANGGRLFAFGNGGSATDAQQLATLFLCAGSPAFALSNDTAIVTALCNDVGVEVVFARQLAAFAGPKDIAVGLSTSGNSANLLRAFDEASRRGLLTIGLAGYDGGKLAELAAPDEHRIDYLFVQPSTSIHRIQEAQTTTYQVLWELTQALLSQQEMSHVPRHTG